VLDTLKSNQSLEPLYHATARRAFQFCKRNARKNEFRRLCELLRYHVAGLQQPLRYTPTQPIVNIASADTQQAHLLTRFEQLGVATELELWQEAFRAIEDISGLMALSAKRAPPRLVAQYYAKLAEIFFASGNELYHAYAYFRFYSISRAHNKALTPAEIAAMASKLLLATLAVPTVSDTDDVALLASQNDPEADALAAGDAQKAKHARMAALLGTSLV
jgi:translation initiation factor 3 subunit A